MHDKENHQTVHINIKEEFLRFEENKLGNQKALDNLVFIIGTGIFVLSANYIVGLKDNYLHSPGFLLLAWLLIAISIISHAFAYKIVVIREQYIVDRLHDMANNKKMDETGHPALHKITKSRNKKIDTLNDVALYSLIGGIISLLIFSCINFILINNKNITGNSNPNSSLQASNR